MKDNIIKFCSTSIYGLRYNVFHKDDTDESDILYMGLVTKDRKNDQCTCIGFSLLKKCYHNEFARSMV